MDDLYESTVWVGSVFDHDFTPLEAAQEFAKKHFEEPRKVQEFICLAVGWQFTLANGINTYRMTYSPYSPGKQSPRYEVYLFQS